MLPQCSDLRRKEKPATRMVTWDIWRLLVILFQIIRSYNVEHFLPKGDDSHA